MSRDPSRSVDTYLDRNSGGACGYVTDEATGDFCGDGAVYRFRLHDWATGRIGHACPQHALVVRRWDVEYMRTKTAVTQ